MNLLNIEIKARCRQPDQVRQILIEQQARFIGSDHQIDTYFRCQRGRLKLREGNIEHHLIFYERGDQFEPKPSHVMLYNPQPDPVLKEILRRALGVLVVVDKKREIYYIENVKFHIDRVEELGTFMEIEAIDRTGAIGEKRLRAQCQQYMQLFDIRPADLISCSYSDLLLAARGNQVP